MAVTITTSHLETNPFRVLALGGSASLKEAERQAQRMSVIVSVGADPYENEACVLPPSQQVDEFMIGYAIQSLRDPYERLVAEAFWFRSGPSASHSIDQRAFEKVRESDFASAKGIWQEATLNRKETISTHALHHLAVMHFALALKEERTAVSLIHGDSPLPPVQIELWKQTKQYWNQLINQKAFWDYLRERVIDINDPRLKIQAIDEFRRDLKETLPRLHASLALESLNAGRIRIAMQHIEMGIEADVNGASAVLFGLVFNPIKQRIHEACESALKMSHATDSDILEVYQTLIDICRPEVETLRALDPRNVLLTAPNLNEVAETLRQLSVTLANRLSQYKRAKQITIEAQGYATSETTKANLSKLINDLQDEIDGGWDGVDSQTCWFCEARRSGSEEKKITVKMHKITGVENNGYSRRTYYNTVSFAIPRCEECAKYHSSNGNIFGGIFVFGLFLLFGFIGVLANYLNDDQIGYFIESYVLAWVLTFVAVGLKRLHHFSGIHGYARYKKYPLYKKYIKDNYSLGEKPAS